MKVIPKIIIFFCSWFFPLAASAQVTVDGTTSTTVTPTDTGVRIENGNRNGGNLFHSFDTFSIPTGSEAYFNNPSDLVNIFSRVTGGNISNINGLIRANGGANLFLINPAGIVFGEGARLQLGGSFYGSTADSIVFPDGEFSATDLDNPPLITINAPIGLNFRDEPQPIINQSTANGFGLQVDAGETIGLIGGDIEIVGSDVSLSEDNPTNNITAQGAKVWLGGLAESGTVNLEENVGFSLPNGVARADVFFSNGARVDVASAGDGEITVIGKNITLAEGSQLIGGIARDLGTIESQAGDITIDATGGIELSGASSIENPVGENATGNSGNINVTGASLSLIDGGRLSTSTFGRGNAGDITVETTGTVTLDGVAANGQRSRMASGIAEDATGEGGNITISSGSLSLTDGALLNTETAGFGNAGDIAIETNGAVTLAGIAADGDESSIASGISQGATGEGGNINISADSLSLANGALLDNRIATAGSGNAGNITITANFLSLANRAFLSSNTFGGGNAGLISISIDDTIAIDSSSGILSSVASAFSSGNAGGIEITTTNLTITNGGQINANTFGEGNAGKIIIKANDTITIDGEDTPGFPSGIFSAVGDTGIGDAGGIEITTANLTLTDGGKVNASTFGRGNAAIVKIDANNAITLEGRDSSDFGSGIFSNVEEDGIGNAGGIELTTSNLTLAGGGTVSASTLGQGNAGIIRINASNSIFTANLDSDIISTVGNNAKGNAGGIEIFTGSLAVTELSEISASSTGDGNGGDVEIYARDLNLNRGKISATNEPSITTTEEREGGNINLEIDRGLVRLSNGSLISARAGNNASGGNIRVDADLILAFPNQNNDITANAVAGNGGNIEILTKSILGIEEGSLSPLTNDINASSQFGIDGGVSVETPDNNPFRETTELSQNTVSPGIVTANACNVSGTQGAVGTLVVKGKGGVSSKPIDTLNSDGLIMLEESEASDVWQNYNPSESKKLTVLENLEPDYIPPHIEPVAYQDNGEPIYLARGVIKQKDGSVILTAAPQNNSANRTFFNPYSCE